MKVTQAVTFWLEYHKANSPKNRVKLLMGLILMDLSYLIPESCMKIDENF
jgi:hypothetical protein